ncbi:MAG TPA: hypothetical protein VE621_03205 [Bryobacteraceae bacterium]|nr:hypothetical protein [Bryobacteraceae bacterium]
MIDEVSRLDARLISEALQRILASPEFSSSARMSRFVEHVVERTLAGRAQELKESLIGVNVFDRTPGYDPKYDAIVRVEARRLRTKLSEYYAASGGSDPVRVVLPKGSYVPEFVTAPAVQAPPQPASEPSPMPPEAPIASPSKSTRWQWWALGAVCLTGAVLFPTLRPKAVNEERIRPFTTLPGYERKPAFSPDGAAIAFGWAGPGEKTTRIFVQPLDSETATPITSGEGNDVAAAWSPDGATIAFYRERGNGKWDLMMVPAGGGSERKLAEIGARFNTELSLSWAGDGSYLLTSSRADSSSLPSLVRINAASGETTPVSESRPGDFFPDLSPDGKSIAFLHESTSDTVDLIVSPWNKGALDTGRSRTLSPERSAISGFDWLPDAGSIIYSSDRRGMSELWQVSAHGGTPNLIPGAPSEALTPAIAPRSGRMAFVHRFREINIWGVRPDGGNRRRVISSTAEEMNPQFSPDGSRLVFRSNRSGNMEIWTAARDGSKPVRLTRFEGARLKEPHWSPDGRLILFVASTAGNAHLYTIPAVGGTPQILFESKCNEAAPNWSRDGKSVYYVSDCGGTEQVRKRALEGGAEKVLTTNGGTAPIEHSDGFVYFFNTGTRAGIWRIPRDGGTEEIVYPGMANSLWGNWAVAGDGLYHVRYGGISAPSVLQFFDFKTRRDREVTVFAEHPVLWNQSLAVSPDGGEVVFSQLDRAGADILLLEHAK